MRTRATLVIVVLAALLATAAPADARGAGAPVGPTATVAGHGYGHGKGMSQWGAYGAAKAGLGYRQILSFYYPGTRVGSLSARVRVWISSDADHNTIVRPARGLRIVDLTFALPTGSR